MPLFLSGDSEALRAWYPDPEDYTRIDDGESYLIVVFADVWLPSSSKGDYPFFWMG